MIISTQTKLIIAAIVTAFTFIMPETIIWLLHEIVVGLFELLEGALDEIIEHLFHTDRHTTQVIVFYLMWAMFIYGLYRLYRYLKNLYAVVKIEFPGWRSQKWEQISVGWNSLPIAQKFKMISGYSLGAACFVLLMF